jgi:hypothetical protein
MGGLADASQRLFAKHEAGKNANLVHFNYKSGILKI